MSIFVNVPYKMIEKNLERAASLSIGLEIYLDNHLIEEVDMDHARSFARS